MFLKFKNFVSLFYKAFGAYKLHIVALTVLGFLNGIVGGIGISALIPVFSFVVNPDAVASDPISKTIQFIFQFIGISFNLKFLLIFIVSLFIFRAVILVIFSYLTVGIIASYEERTRSSLFRTVFKTKWAHLLKQRLGHLETILIINVQNSQNIFAQVSSSIMILTSLIVYTAVAVSISYKITIMTFVIGGFIFIFIKPLIGKLRRLSYEQERINRDVSHHINENVVGMKTVKAFAADKRVSDIAEGYFKKIKSLRIKTNVFNNMTSIFVEPVGVIFIVSIFIISYKTAGFNLAALAAVIYLIKQIFQYIQQFQTLVIGLNTTTPFLRSLIEYDEQAKANREDNLGEKDFVFKQTLSFKNVGFRYEVKQILQGLNFEVGCGEMVGIIGPSGAGKTTLVDLLLRLLYPTDGQILVDGTPVQDVSLPAWRKNIGYVSQDTFLSNDSIKNNIKFYDDSITENQVIEAAKMADIYDFISGLPNGFDTSVGERGVMLSGGQRQRIAIARALARNPKILILDEATSSLDNESELKIQEVIKKLKGKLTVIVIAHRLSTIQSSDRIISIKDGKIEREGKPEELLKDRNSYFYKVYNIRK